MSKRLFAILSLIAALGLGTPALLADHGDKGSKHKHEGKHFDDDDQGWNDVTGTSIAFTTATISVPPGWSRGKKTGSGNCGLPPGQAKKYGCQSYIYEGRPYYYYQDDAGQIIVHRPIIEVHATVDIH